MQKLYELCDLEKVVLKRLKEKGFKYIIDDLLFVDWVFYEV